MTQTITFAVPTARILNANQRSHWARKAELTRFLRTEASLHAHGIPPMSRAHLTVHVGWPDKRRRDAMNVHPTIKACVDGFVDAGLLDDDSDKYLTGPDLRPFTAGRRGYVVLTFEFKELPA